MPDEFTSTHTMHSSAGNRHKVADQPETDEEFAEREANTGTLEDVAATEATDATEAPKLTVVEDDGAAELEAFEDAEAMEDPETFEFPLPILPCSLSGAIAQDETQDYMILSYGNVLTTGTLTLTKAQVVALGKTCLRLAPQMRTPKRIEVPGGGGLIVPS